MTCPRSHSQLKGGAGARPYPPDCGHTVWPSHKTRPPGQPGPASEWALVLPSLCMREPWPLHLTALTSTGECWEPLGPRSRLSRKARSCYRPAGGGGRALCEFLPPLHLLLASPLVPLSLLVSCPFPLPSSKAVSVWGRLLSVDIGI